MPLPTTEPIQVRGWRPSIWMLAIGFPILIATLCGWSLVELTKLSGRVRSGETSDLRDEVKLKIKLFENEMTQLRLLIEERLAAEEIDNFLAGDAARLTQLKSAAEPLAQDALSDAQTAAFLNRNEFDRRALPIYWENPYLEIWLLDEQRTPLLRVTRSAPHGSPPAKSVETPAQAPPEVIDLATLLQSKLRQVTSDRTPAVEVSQVLFDVADDRRPYLWAVGASASNEPGGPGEGFVAVRMNLKSILHELINSPRHLTFLIDSRGRCLSTPWRMTTYPGSSGKAFEPLPKYLADLQEWNEASAKDEINNTKAKAYGNGDYGSAFTVLGPERYFFVARISDPPPGSANRFFSWMLGRNFSGWPEKSVAAEAAWNQPGNGANRELPREMQPSDASGSQNALNSLYWRFYLAQQLENLNTQANPQEPHPGLLFTPVLDGASPRYLVSGSSPAALRAAQKAIREAFQEAPPGTVLFSPDITSFGQERGFAGYYERASLSADESGEFLGMLVCASRAEIDSEIKLQMGWAKTFIWSTVISIIVLAVMAYFFVSYPISTLRQVSREVASGDFDWGEIQDKLHMVIRRYGFYDEVRAFASSFDGMAAAIVERDHRLRQEVREKSATVSMLAEGLVTFDGTGAILSFNRAAEEIFGCEEHVMRGQNFETLFAREPCGSGGASALHDPNQSLEIRRITLALIRESIPEATLTASDSTNFKSTRVFRRWAWYGSRCGGLCFPCEVAVSKLRPFGGKEFYSLVTRDVTDQCQSRERIARLNDELQQKNDELEVRVSERTHELNQQRDQLLRTNNELTVSNAQASADLRALDSFMATMNHELRTPLNAIIGFSNMLKIDAERNNNARAVKNLTFVLTAGQRLLELVNDILDLAKIRSGKVKVELTNFAISEVIDEAVVFCGPRAEEHKNQLVVSVAPDTPSSIFADRRRVGQIVLNLMSNAVKFTKNGTITLSARQVFDEGVGFIEFAVRDTGAGIAEADLPLLFRPFSQVGEGLGKHPGGTGLGLSITKTLTELMGGMVLPVESKLGVGSVFRVWIPCKVELAGEPASQTPHSTQPTQITLPAEAAGLLIPAATTPTGSTAGLRRSVLVIDDDPAQRELVSQMLHHSGFQVLVAESGEEGLALARKSRPDGILLDVLLPGIDGWNVLQQLKQDAATADTPVILISQLTDQQSGFGLGAADYLVKPVRRDRLLTILRRYCGAKPAGPILVVEDDEAQRSLMVQILQQEGWSVREAANGKVALEHLASDRPALILLDLLMPIMDGFELLYELQKEEDWRSIPVVVVTSVDLDETTRRRLSGRVEQVLEKGAFRREDLLELVCRCMAYCPVEISSDPS